MLIAYKVVRGFHFGALRTSLPAGACLESDGATVRYLGKVYSAVGFDQLVAAGFVAPVEGERSLPAVVPQSKALPAPRTKPITVASTIEEKGAGVPAYLQPDKKHVWETELFGNGEKTCTVCGVTMSNPMSINVSKQSFKYIYTDAYGVSISTLKELPCPLFVGDVGGGVASNTDRTRRLTGKVESIDERVGRLEAENTELRERADKRQEVALDLLSRLVSAAERLVELGDTEITHRLLPDQADIIDAIVVERPERERVPVRALQEESDE